MIKANTVMKSSIDGDMKNIKLDGSVLIQI